LHPHDTIAGSTFRIHCCCYGNSISTSSTRIMQNAAVSWVQERNVTESRWSRRQADV
jgi:hypothetical protein